MVDCWVWFGSLFAGSRSFGLFLSRLLFVVYLHNAQAVVTLGGFGMC